MKPDLFNKNLVLDSFTLSNFLKTLPSNWFSDIYEKTYNKNSVQSSFIHVTLYETFKDGIPQSDKYSSKSNNKVKLDLSSLKLARITDYLTHKSMKEIILSSNIPGKKTDAEVLSDLDIIIRNVIYNMDLIDKPMFIEKYEEKISKIELSYKLENGAIYFNKIDSDTLKYTVSIMKAFKTLNHDQRNMVFTIYNSLKSISNFYQTIQKNSIKEILTSIGINDNISKQLKCDIYCMILDIIDETIIREQKEDEEIKTYKVYRHKKINSILHTQD